MKIITCNTYENTGGAAIAAKRLHDALLQNEINSQFLVINKETDSTHTNSLIKTKTDRIKRALLNQLNHLDKYLYKNTSKDTYSTFPFLPSFEYKIINSMPHDIVHLHWITDFISPYALSKIKKPVVLTLHDAWFFTGGCHFFDECNNYTNKCNNCPLLNKHQYNLASLTYYLKNKAYQKIKPTIITPSKYFTKKAQGSKLLCDYNIINIPNCIDINKFYPMNKHIAKNLLKIPQNTPVILFGAINATADKRKGFDLLVKALSLLPQHTKKKPLCLIFGSSQSKELATPFPAQFLGKLNDNISLALAYSAADIFICPSRQDNLPNTVLESLSCGTPVVSFDVGGIPDMVEHLQNGYIAKCYDTNELAKGIATIINNEDLQLKMQINARKKVEQNYSYEVIAKKHEELYHKILHIKKT